MLVLVALTALGAVAARVSAAPLPSADDDPIGEAWDAADALEWATAPSGELPGLLGPAAVPDPSDDGDADPAPPFAGAADRGRPAEPDRYQSPLGRVELSAEWRRHEVLTAEPRRQVDELWLLLSWSRS